MTLRIKKSFAWGVAISAILFLFALGMQASFLVEFVESDRRLLNGLRSLEETATWEP